MPLIFRISVKMHGKAYFPRARYFRTSVLLACHEVSSAERGPAELSVTLIWIAAQSGIRLEIYMTGSCGGPTAR